MNTSASELVVPAAVAASVVQDALVVDLSDGRIVQVPLAWYPRLLNATETERANLRLIGAGNGIHWPDLDEDVSVESVLKGKPSMESDQSLKRWLAARAGQ